MKGGKGGKGGITALALLFRDLHFMVTRMTKSYNSEPVPAVPSVFADVMDKEVSKLKALVMK